MEHFSKKYVEGLVLSFDGRVYTFLLPGDESAVLKYETVHDRCTFPPHLMENGHLKVGASIHICIIDRGDSHSVLPDHRYYLYSTFKKDRDGNISVQDNKTALNKTAEIISRCARMFSDGHTDESLFILRTLISQLDPTV